MREEEEAKQESKRQLLLWNKKWTGHSSATVSTSGHLANLSRSKKIHDERLLQILKALKIKIVKTYASQLPQSPLVR